MDSSNETNLEYWKEQAQLYKSKFEQDLDTYQENLATSQEIERELEVQLQMAESEKEQYKTRYQQMSIQFENLQNIAALSERVNFLENENSILNSNYEAASNQIRRLEQFNDDLERANRATAFSMEDFEAKLNSALERNALLENELDEKENLLITIQRLKDEARDLQAELNARQRANSQLSQPKWSHQTSIIEEASKDRTFTRIEKNDSELSSTTPHLTSLQDCFSGTSRSRMMVTESSLPQFTSKQEAVALLDVTPTVRVTALNMINELLRKINHLEVKLSSMYAAFGNQNRSSIIPPDLLNNSKVQNTSIEEVSTTTGLSLFE